MKLKFFDMDTTTTKNEIAKAFLKMFDATNMTTQGFMRVTGFNFANISCMRKPEMHKCISVNGWNYIKSMVDNPEKFKKAMSGEYRFNARPGYVKPGNKSIVEDDDIMTDGYKFVLVNEARFNPANFGIPYHADGYDGFACYWEDNRKGKRFFSLYSDNGKTDCSEICKKRGGGGHFGAAGFSMASGFLISQLM